MPFNDAAAVEQALREHEIACVILEPVAGNMGVVPPAPGYLQRLRGATQAAGALLIFDEVMIGFRVGPGGAQERFDVLPDLTTMGKVIGGGLPVGAYGGSRELMDRVAPSGPVYQAGTLAGNPLAMAAGAATLSALAENDLHERLEALGRRLEEGIGTGSGAEIRQGDDRRRLTRHGSIADPSRGPDPAAQARVGRLGQRAKRQPHAVLGPPPRRSFPTGRSPSTSRAHARPPCRPSRPHADLPTVCSTASTRNREQFADVIELLRRQQTANGNG